MTRHTVPAVITGHTDFSRMAIACPTLSVPPGETPDSLLALMRSVRQEGQEGAELEGYLARDWRRFVYTLQLCQDVKGRCLEIGAGPYFTTVLLREFTDLSLTLTNYFGVPQAQGEDHIRYDSRRGVDDGGHTLSYDHFNVEDGRFPYPDGHFDLVLFCEVLEHLTHDPLPALREIHRVLKPGGGLVLTTPNVASARNLLRLFRGDNVHDRYSGYGPYGRHNREYTLDEVAGLLGHCGFAVTRGFTANVKDSRAGSRFAYAMARFLFRLISRRRADTLGQYLFVAAERAGEPKAGWPDWLFRSFGHSA